MKLVAFYRILIACSLVVALGNIATAQDNLLMIVGETKVCPKENYEYRIQMVCPPGKISWYITGGSFVGDPTNQMYATVDWNENETSLVLSAEFIATTGELPMNGCDPTGQPASFFPSWRIPPATVVPVPADPTMLNSAGQSIGATNKFCAGETIKLTTSAAAAAFPIQYVWQVRINGGAPQDLGIRADNTPFNYTIPSLSTNTASYNTISFQVKTQFASCTRMESVWRTSGTLYVYSVGPSSAITGAFDKICETQASVKINITSGSAATQYFIAFANQTSPNNGDVSASFTGSGEKTFSLNPAFSGAAPYTYSYQLRYYITDPQGGTYPSECPASTSTFTVKDASYALSLTLTPIAEKCVASNDGGVNLTVNNGTGTYTYQWTNSANATTWATEDIGGLNGNNTYTVAVKEFNGNGCTGSGNVLVSEPSGVAIDNAFLASDHGGYGVSCNPGNIGGLKNDGAITIEASGGTGALQYRAEGATHTAAYQTAATLNGLYADLYTVYVKDNNGCETAYGQPVEVTAAPPVAFGALQKTDLLCANEPQGSILVQNPSGGVGGFQYSINGGPYQGIPLFSGLSANAYTVTIRDGNGCTQQGSTTLMQPPVIVPGSISSVLQSCAEKTDGVIRLMPATGGTGARTYSVDNSNYISEASPASFAGLVSGNYTVYIKDANNCVVTTGYFLDSRPAITGAIAPSQPISCQGMHDGSLNLTPGGGTGPYSFAWSTTATTEDITGLGDGTYTVTITDNKGCQKDFSYAFQEPGVLSLDPAVMRYAGYGVRCKGSTDGQIDLTVSGGTTPYSYAWSNGATTQDVSALAPGFYNIAVIDAHGCPAAVSNLEVKEPTAVALDPASVKNVSCKDGSDGVVTLTANGGAGFYEYSFNGTVWQDEATFQGLQAVAYTFSMRDVNGCSIQRTVTLTEPEKLVLSPVSKTETTCGEANGKAEVVAAGGTAGYAYAWYDIQNNNTQVSATATATALASGDYHVIARDLHACEAELTVIINTSDGPQIAQQLLEGLTCFESNDGKIAISIAKGAAPYTIAWDIAGETGLAVNDVTGGEHWVEVHDTKGCRAKQVFQVSFPEKLAIDYTLTEPSCTGLTNGSIVVNGTGGNGGYQYQWDAGGQTTSLANVAAGTYGITLTDIKNCNLHQAIVLQDPAPFVVNAGEDRTLCVGQKLTVRAEEDNATYRWTSTNDFTSTDREVTIVQPGTYTLTVISAKGCTADDSFVLSNSTDLLKADFLMATEAYAGDTVVVVDISWPEPENISWKLPQGATLVQSDDIYAEVVFATAGDYSILLNSFLGECISELTKAITIHGERETPGGRTGQSVIARFDIFPNPSDGRFTIRVDLSDSQATGRLQMIGASGNNNLLDQSIRGSVEYDYSGRKPPAGVYFILLEAQGERRVRRIIIR